MKDILGTEIKLGDNVIYIKHFKSSNQYIRTKVVGFTNCMVKIIKDIPDTWEKECTLISPSNCIIITKLFP